MRLSLNRRAISNSDSRWALAWFEHYGFAEGEFGVAETLSKAKNTSVSGMVDAGILSSSRGKVRLLEACRATRKLGTEHLILGSPRGKWSIK